jgi:hypothetical protein
LHPKLAVAPFGLVSYVSPRNEFLRLADHPNKPFITIGAIQKALA